MPIDPEALCMELDCCPEGFGVDDITVSEALIVEEGNCSTVGSCQVVTGITLTNQGSGYTSTPLVTIGPPPVGGIQATASILPASPPSTLPGMVGGQVAIVTITDPGSLYGSGSPAIIPSVTFTGGSPTVPATAVATIYSSSDSLINLQTESYDSILS